MPSHKGFHPLPGTRDDPNLHESNDKMLLNRDDGLADISRLALAQLTSLLSMGTSNNISKPSAAWLQKQEAKIATLHWSLQAPSNLIERLALRINRHRRIPFFPQVAQLCSSHKGLDPRVIRNLTLLVGHECTLRTDRFRLYRSRIAFPNHVTTWLDRIDSVTAMWVGQKAFEMVFGYKSAMPAIQSVESGCEACIMAVVGARPQLLCDLRASMLARKMRSPDDPTDPRLLRIVDSWIEHYHEEARDAVNKASEKLASDIFDIYKEMKRRKEKRTKERRDAGKPVRMRRHRHRHRRRDDGLPTPTQPPEGRYSRRMSLLVYDDDVSYNTSSEVPLLIEHDQLPAEDDNQNGRETWAWLEGRMEGQGLTADERARVLGSIHPAFSEFRAPSAKPAPLSSRSSPKKDENGVADTDEIDDGRTWMSCTVHTVDDGRYPAEIAPPVPPVPGLYRQDATLQNDRIPKRYHVELDEDDSDEDYVPPRKGWAPSTPTRNPFSGSSTAATAPQPSTPSPRTTAWNPPPASSFYSEHPGFPKDHQTTVLFRNPFDGGRAVRKESNGDSQVSPKGGKRM
ncbi:Fc.00g108750.m01.CDS01 [Cosmosporella sp. VM-42]